MRIGRDNTAYLRHIADASAKILDYTSRHGFDEFAQNEWDQSAIVRYLEIIGEAANNIDKEFLNQYHDIPWRTIINLRNVLIHDYVDIDLEIVWQICTHDLMDLQRKVLVILELQT